MRSFYVSCFFFLATCSLLAAEMLPSLELSANTIKLIYIVMMGMSMFLQVETLKKHSSHAKAVDEAKVAKTSLQSQVTQLAEKHEHERQNLERDLTDARNQAANHKQNLETALSQKEGQQKQIARLEAEKTRLENSQQSSQEAINLLSLLQQHGRLIDFSEQDISSIPNEQVGAAARVVHQGCAKVLKDHFQLEPLRNQNEGDSIEISSEEPSRSYRILGSTPTSLPYRGKVLHQGWGSKSVNLPQSTIQGMQGSKFNSMTIVSPSEIEIS